MFYITPLGDYSCLFRPLPKVYAGIILKTPKIYQLSQYWWLFANFEQVLSALIIWKLPSRIISQIFANFQEKYLQWSSVIAWLMFLRFTVNLLMTLRFTILWNFFALPWNLIYFLIWVPSQLKLDIILINCSNWLTKITLFTVFN